MSLRDRKRARTRQALIDAAAELFARKGYEATTIADIAATADIGARTFFSYFPSKEDLLFPEGDRRVRIAVEAIAHRSPDEEPADVLLRALSAANDDSADLTGPLAALRIRLTMEVPAVRGRALQLLWESQREIAGHLAAAYPDRLTEVSAAALVGAFVGAVTGALATLMRDPTRRADPAAIRESMQRATEIALRPWASQKCPGVSPHAGQVSYSPSHGGTKPSSSG
ncbi:TetR family transcriptional regulator [Rhizomonospora bruguierae]|uniref:TetR family transcriptional regulator n=1 Tax=Rhizomonospora bruguierae TaxID=1581705 RepID=UPI001BCF6296|nr:TetR family transcriptional regulator [Micromonospora sp. NBRC 107566]